MALSAAMIAAIATGDFFWAVELGSNALRYAEGDLSSAGRGLFQGRILEPGISSWGSGMQRFQHSLEGQSISVTLADYDRAISSEVAGYGSAPTLTRGSQVLIRVCSLSVAPASWDTRWTGILDSYDMVAPNRWQLTFRPNDLPLTETLFPRQRWTVGAHFPKAPASSRKLPAPLVFGIHNSVGSTGAGAVSGIRVGPGQYLFGAGGLADIWRVYVNGDLQDAADWSWSIETIDGQSWSIVEFVEDPAVNADGAVEPDSVEVTADVDGLTSVGDGSGTVVTDPVDCLRLLLDNFVFGDWASGAWDTTSANVDTAAFSTVKTFLAGQGQGGLKAARVIDSARRGGDELREWCYSFVVYPVWNASGQLSLKVDDPRDGATYISDPWIRREEVLAISDDSDLEITHDVTQIRDRVDVEFLTVGGAALQTLQARDRGISGQLSQDTRAMSWGRASAI